MSGDDALSDRSGLTLFALTQNLPFIVFDTLGSVALTSATEMARATLTFLQLYGWKQASVLIFFI